MFRSGILTSLSIAVSICCYLLMAYGLERHESWVLLSGYILLFVAFLTLWYYTREENVNRMILIAIMLRMILLAAFPNLSDDIYRFVWDGRLLNAGIHPFGHVPSWFMLPGSPDIPGVSSRLFYLLNSPDYYTIYPPMAQILFAFSTAVFPDSVHGSALVIRIFIIMAETGSILLIKYILFHYKLPAKSVLLYALNPLVIIELTGNLHFEAFLIFFLLASIYFFITRRRALMALSFAFAIASKLLPLIFLPLFIKRMRVQNLLLFYLLTALFSFILFLPFINMELVKGMTASISLYFQRFEFNASIYYLVREIGFYFKGYNIIGAAGKYLAFSAFIGIMFYALLHNAKKIKLPEAMLWVLMVYMAFSTTLHPWYITTPLALGILSRYRFMVLWTFLIFFTYAGYTSRGFDEYLWITTIEYCLVAVFILYELIKSRRLTPLLDDEP